MVAITQLSPKVSTFATDANTIMITNSFRRVDYSSINFCLHVFIVENICLNALVTLPELLLDKSVKKTGNMLHKFNWFKKKILESLYG